MRSRAWHFPFPAYAFLDLTRVLAGPYCTMVLGDLGAEIIKVEPSGTGDDSRAFGPFIRGESSYFMSLNRNKKSLTLNLKTAAGKDILKKLAQQADVLIENYRPGTMKKLGLDYTVLSAENPRLVYAAISGFGQEGPSKDKPAYDFIVQGMGGMMGSERPSGRPPHASSDRAGGHYRRVVYGRGDSIGPARARPVGPGADDRHLHARLPSGHSREPNRALLRRETPKPIGNTHPTISPTGGFPTKDGYVILAIGNDQHWKVFCEAVGRPGGSMIHVSARMRSGLKICHNKGPARAIVRGPRDCILAQSN